MSFRRYTPSTPSNPSNPSPSPSASASASVSALPQGIKPASHPVTSTGTSTLDTLLSMSSGLPMSSSLLIEEHGTGNYAGVLLRQYVAEGVVQGHRIWIGGVGETWWRGIPGLSRRVEQRGQTDSVTREVEEKMKIAWRYGVGDAVKQRGGERTDGLGTMGITGTAGFCHVFDIQEQLPLPPKNQVHFSPLPSTPRDSDPDPFSPLLLSLQAFLKHTPATQPTRLVLPDFLNPLLYNPTSSQPQHVLRFVHSVTAMLVQQPYCTMLVSLSTSFYAREGGLTGWLEHLCSHVVQLCPLNPAEQHNPGNPGNTGKLHNPTPQHTAAVAGKQPQGLVKVWKGGLRGREMAYRVGRRGMVLEEWSLPPLEEETPRVRQGFVIETEGQQGQQQGGRKSFVSGVSAKELEF